MKENNQIYRSIFLIIMLLFGVMTLYTIKTDEVPRFILFLGRFHPLALHLPIGALVVTFFIDIIGRIQKNYSIAIIRNLLGFTALFSIITCFLGYFLSLEGGYQEQTLDIHFYAGIITAIATTILFFISLQPTLKSNKVFLFLFMLSLVGITVTGHYGSILTHGDQFLTEYAGTPEKERTIQVVDSLKIYKDVVVKILDEKCVQCHNATKQKGELSLISKNEILKGGVNGTSIVAGNASSSLLYNRLLLPLTDEEHMPPEGKEQLTKDEIWLLKYWINEGVDFENYVTNTAANDTLRNTLKKYLVFNKIEIAKASATDIEEVQEAGFRVLELVPGKPELNVKLLQTKPTKEVIEKLEILEEQIVELDCSDAEITDEMTTVLKKLKHLKFLRINSKQLTDVSLQNLKNLAHLEVLNLYKTSVTNEGISSLLQEIQPKKIYVWETQIDKETATALSQEHKVDIQQSILAGFVKKSQLKTPFISPAKTLFKDTIHINAKSRIKDVTLRYTLNEAIPDSTSTIFDNTLVLDHSQTLKISAFKKGWIPSDVLVREYAKVQYQPVDFTMKYPPDERYPDAAKLFDLQEGTRDFKDGNWTGYFGSDLYTTIDLGAVKTVDNISFHCMEDVASWILFPTDVIVYTSLSKNGPFKKVSTVKIAREGQGGEVKTKKVHITMPDIEGRYFRIHIKNHKKLPNWHPNAGSPSWLFVDEIYFW